MYYRKNIEVLHEGLNYIKELVDSYVPQFKTTEVEGLTCYDNTETIIVKKDNMKYRLNSIYSPEFEAREWMTQFKTKGIHNKFVLFGLSQGSFAREVLKSTDETTSVIILEPSIDILSYVIKNFDLTDILSDPRIHIIYGENCNEDLFQLLIKSISDRNIINNEYKVHPKYHMLFQSEVKKYWEVINNVNKFAHVNANTYHLFGQKMIDNICNNIKYMTDGYMLSDLSHILNLDRPAIVVAAGPTLEDDLDMLREAVKYCTIFAVDRVLDYLLDNSIIPHFIVSLDPVKSLEYFTVRDDLTIPLITYLDASSAVLNKHKGKKIFAGVDAYMSETFKSIRYPHKSIPAGGSVATSAVTICMNLMFKTIVLVGHDLSFGKGKSHVGGVLEEYGLSTDIYVKGINGDVVKSRHDWVIYLEYMERLIKANPSIQVIDVKKYGAYIEGTEQKSLKETIDLYKNEYSVYKNIMVSSIDENVKTKIIQEIKIDVETLNKIGEKISSVLKKYDSLLAELSDTKYFDDFEIKVAKSIKNINDYILNEKVYWLMEHYINANSNQSVSELLRLEEDKIESKRKTYQLSKDTMLVAKNAVNYILPKLSTVLNEFEDNK